MNEKPRISINPGYQYAEPGETVGIELRISNTDSKDSQPATFQVSVLPPNLVYSNLDLAKFTLEPGKFISLTLEIQMDMMITEGQKIIRINVEGEDEEHSNFSCSVVEVK